MPIVKILHGFVVETSRGVFLGGTTADLSDSEIADNPSKTEALLTEEAAPTIGEPAPTFMRIRADQPPVAPKES